MAYYPAQLQSANLEQYGIVYAEEIQGHKTVSDLDALYEISDAILSKSTDNTDSDALGQEWYVVSEGCYYRLDDWSNRNNASGWRKMQNVDEEFDSLQEHGADKINSFTTTDSTVSLNYNTWYSSTSNVDGSVTIPAATGDQAGVLTADGKDQLDQLDKLSAVTHLNDGNVFTNTADSVTINYQCISVEGGSTSNVQTITEDLPVATGDLAGILTADGKDQLNQLNKLSAVTHLNDGSVFTSTTDNVTINYQCISVTEGSTSSVQDITENLPVASSTSAGTMSSSDKDKIDSISLPSGGVEFSGNNTDVINGAGESVNLMNKFPDTVVTGITSVTTDSTTNTINFTTSSKGSLEFASSTDNTVTIPAATGDQAGVLSADGKDQLDQLDKLGTVTHMDDGSVFTSTASNVAINYKCVSVESGSTSSVQNYTENLPVASSSSAGVMTAEDYEELHTNIPQNIADNYDAIMNLIVNLHASITFSANRTVIYKGESDTVTISHAATFDGNPLTYTLTVDGEALANPYTLEDSHTFTGIFSIDNDDPDVAMDITKTLTVNAYYPRYYGYSTSTTIDSSGVLALTKQARSSSAAISNMTVNFATAGYLWLCVPSGMTVSSVTSSGFGVPMNDPITVAVSGKGNYLCYRSTNEANAGSITYVVS